MLTVNNVARFIRVFARKWYLVVRKTVVRLTICVALFVLLLWFSAFLYGVFFYAYMPHVSHIKTVHLQFSTDCDKPPADGLCSFPSSNVTLARPDMDQYLMPGQPYKIFVEIELPPSPVNQNLGMFMVLLRLSGRGGVIVRESLRSTMLRYKSEILQLFSTLLYLPLFLLDISEEKQLLNVSFFEYYLDDAYNPVTHVFVEMQTKHIELYRATLKVHAHFTGLRYFMFNWPLVTTIIGVAANMTFLTAVVALSWYRFMWMRENQQVVVKVGFEKTFDERRSQMKKVLSKSSLAGRQAGGLPSPYTSPNLATGGGQRSPPAHVTTGQRLPRAGVSFHLPPDDAEPDEFADSTVTSSMGELRRRTASAT